MQISERLKRETLTIHKAIERQSLAKKIINRSISTIEYKTLLLQHLGALSKVRFELKACLIPEAIHFRNFYDQDDRIEAITKDLALCEGQFEPNMEIRADSEDLGTIVGSLYVVEGASMGHLIISKHVKSCPALKERGHHYYRPKEPKQVIERWNRFKRDIDNLDLSENQIELAFIAARDTFGFFGTYGR